MYIGYETPMEQAGLRKGCEGNTKMSKSFIDYTKDSDSVQHLKMCNSISSVGITEHLTVLK
jgi:hypothetical protein